MRVGKYKYLIATVMTEMLVGKQATNPIAGCQKRGGVVRAQCKLTASRRRANETQREALTPVFLYRSRPKRPCAAPSRIARYMS